MTILVVGATSQIGHFLLPRLRQRGDAVLALSRRPQSPFIGLRWLSGQLPDQVPALPLLSAIISFGPLPNLAAWLAQTHLPGQLRIIATSSMSAQSKQSSTVPAERALAQLIRATEDDLTCWCEQHGHTLTILRPTLIYGAGLDKSLTPIVRRALYSRWFPLPRGAGLRQPVHADDIALTALAALDKAASSGRILQLGGGERLSVTDMFQRVRASLPAWTIPLPLPGGLLRPASFLLPRLRGPLQRLEQDLLADNTELTQWLGIHPRGFRPDFLCWSDPADTAIGVRKR